VISGAAADAALDLLLAPRCAGCGAAGSWLCLACRDLCEPVRAGRITAAGTYGGALREAIHRFKYGGERALANELGALVAERVAADLAATGATLAAATGALRAAGARVVRSYVVALDA
jgi:predicted amidophosphoribosyltransferase